MATEVVLSRLVDTKQSLFHTPFFFEGGGDVRQEDEIPRASHTRGTLRHNLVSRCLRGALDRWCLLFATPASS